MSLITPSPPPACLEAFIKGLPAFLSGETRGPGEDRGDAGPCLGEQRLGPSARASSIASPGDIGMSDGPAFEAPRISAAQEVLLLHLAEAAHTTGTIHPTASGWRIFAGTGADTVVGRMIQKRIPHRDSHGPSHGSAGQPWKLASLSYGARTADGLTASLALPQMPEVLKADYELRLLAIPGLNVEAFWLKARTHGSPDLMVPFPAGPDQLVQALKKDRVYSLPNFLASIRPLAHRSLQMGPTYGC